MITSLRSHFQRKGRGIALYGVRVPGVLLLCSCAGTISPSRTYIPAEQSPPVPSPVAGSWADTAKPPDQLERGDRLVRLPVARQEDTARRLVRHFFDALASNDQKRVLALLSPTATAVDYRGSERQLSTYWIERLRRFDYTKTVDLHVVWQPHIVVLDSRSDRASKIPAPLKTAADDLFVLVPIERTHVDNQQLFGREIWFRLGRGDGGLQITGYLDDLAPE